MKMKCKEDTWRKGFDNPEFKKTNKKSFDIYIIFYSLKGFHIH